MGSIDSRAAFHLGRRRGMLLAAIEIGDRAAATRWDRRCGSPESTLGIAESQGALSSMAQHEALKDLETAQACINAALLALSAIPTETPGIGDVIPVIRSIGASLAAAAGTVREADIAPFSSARGEKWPLRWGCYADRS